MPNADRYKVLASYHPDYCRKIARRTAVGCLAVLVVEILILLLVDPSTSRCPGWIVPLQHSADSLWTMGALVTGLPTAWICYVALRWDQKFSAKVYESILRPRSSMFGFSNVVEPPLVDFDHLFLSVCVSWCLASAIPLGMMLFGCTSLPTHLGY